jgi:hypothetical protein
MHTQEQLYIYSFNSLSSSIEGTLHIEARNLADAFAQLPHSSYQFVEAFNAEGIRVYG